MTSLPLAISLSVLHLLPLSTSSLSLPLSLEAPIPSRLAFDWRGWMPGFSGGEAAGGIGEPAIGGGCSELDGEVGRGVTAREFCCESVARSEGVR